jgi:hypothetical protein
VSIFPTARGRFFLLRASNTSDRDSELCLIGGAGAPSGGTFSGQTLGATQRAVYFRTDATDPDAMIYWTVNGGTAWTALTIEVNVDSATTGVTAAGAATGADGTGASGGTAPAFTGTAATVAEMNHVTGTGYATAGQVVTTSDNQSLALNECAGMWLLAATKAPCLIVSHPACAAAPAVFTVEGEAPATTAEGYRVLRAPTPAGTVASHTHTGPSHTHAAGAITVTDPGHVHTTS